LSKLKLEQVYKTYVAGTIRAQALRGVSLEFRESEFVSILGPSGCGKTTMLNIVGGLDQYDSGDLVIGGLSTKQFKKADWDAYRNRSIGFVFQNYNLISHQSVLQNVEISMTLSGVSVSERRKRAKEALESVGLGDQLRKKPNQLSGGQMQRVAIARALVNNPDIVLADEPTGALDSTTSVQVMDILREVAKTRLVIMVTHNSELAEQYSSRIIRLLDGQIVSDSNPITEAETASTKKAEPVNKKTLKKTSMSLLTAASLSFRNLLTKKGRTIITAFAGSIGIIGVALVLALSNGMNTYISSMQTEALSGFPITISGSEDDVDFSDMGMMTGETKYEQYPDEPVIHRFDRNANRKVHKNILDSTYITYLEDLKVNHPETVNAISYSYGTAFNVLAKGANTVTQLYTPTETMMGMSMSAFGATYWQEMPNSDSFILSMYDLLGDGSRLPSEKNEVALVIDKHNRLDESFFETIGIPADSTEYNFNDFVGKTILKVIPNNTFYTETEDGKFRASTEADYSALWDSNEAISITITGVLRLKEGVDTGYLSDGFVYTEKLTKHMVDDAKLSDIAIAQSASDENVLDGRAFTNVEKERARALLTLGADTTPTGIMIYPTDFDSKAVIKDYLDEYNDGFSNQDDKVIYNDLAEMITNMTSVLINAISAALVAFAAISLVVSSIMIGIITYVSVIERTKEIGILRSVGARKKDIAWVFNAETMIIGLTAGAMGVLISFLLTFPINMIINHLVGLNTIATLSPFHALFLILGSMTLTFIGGLFPALVAANKDPVVALRTE